MPEKTRAVGNIFVILLTSIGIPTQMEALRGVI